MGACAREFYAASRFLRTFDLARFTAMWTGLLASGAGAIFVLDDGEIRGAIGGVAYPDIYSGELTATEFFWFVSEAHRGGGIRLYRAFERWAKAKGCARIRMVHLMDSMPEKLQTVYERLGFEAAEVHYSKDL
jgi:GNAT superfamily N-acetyltransferase